MDLERGQIMITAFLVLGCNSPTIKEEINRKVDAETELFTRITAQSSTLMQTVIELEVSTSKDVEVFAQYTLADGSQLQTGLSRGEEHTFLLAGIPEENSIEVQLLSGEEHSGQFQVETGQLNYHPQVYSESSDSDGGYIMGVLLGDEKGIGIWNTNSELVWALDLSSEDKFPVQAHYIESSAQIIFNMFDSETPTLNSEIVSVDLLGRSLSQRQAPNHHHSFVPIDDKTVAYLSLDIRETEQYGSVVGDSIIISGESESTLFSCWDHFTVGPTPTWAQEFYSQGIDWTHASGLTYNADDELLTLSLVGLQGVLNIDLNGQIQDAFGGTSLGLTTQLVSDPPFVRPHSARWIDSEIVVFHSPDLQSRGSVLSTKEGEEGWELHLPSTHHALALGDIQPIRDNRFLINYGTSGAIQIHSEENDILFLMETAFGSYFSHATWTPTLSMAQ